jgi:hypothetical protein
MERERIKALIKKIEVLQIGEFYEMTGNQSTLKVRFYKIKAYFEERGIGLKSTETETGRKIIRDF